MISSKTYRSRSEAPNYGSPGCFGALPSVMRIFALLLACFYSQALLAQSPPQAPEFTHLDGQEIGGAGGNHDFTGLPLTQGGWTDLHSLIMSSGYADARIVYVSSSQGNDSTAQVYSPASAAVGGQPLNPAGNIRPYAGLSAAYNQLRDGYPDVLLMRRGDTWSSSLGIAKRGRSNAQRMIVAAYGPATAARPVVGIVSSSSDNANDLILAHYEMSTDSAVGVFRGNNILKEGVSWTYTGIGEVPTVEFWAKNSVYRRGSFRGVMIYSGWGSSEGPNGFNNGLLEECAHYNRPGVQHGPGFRMNIYANDNVDNMTSRYNVSAFSPSTGWRQRGLGTIEGVVVLKNFNLTAFEIGGDVPWVPVLSDSLVMRYNLAMNTDSPWWVTDARSAVIEGNIVSEGDFRYQEKYFPVSNVVFQDNIIRNVRFTFVANSLPITGPWLFRRNDFQRPSGGQLLNLNGNFTFEDNNRFYSSSTQDAWFSNGYAANIPANGTNLQVNYPSPERDIVTYMQSLGASPLGDQQATEWFMYGVPGNASLRGMMNNRYGAWDERFTAKALINYVRAGYGRSPI